MTQSMRMVHDSLGDIPIPEDAYYGAQTARAIQNFPISGLSLPREFIRAQAIIKWAAAQAHRDLGAMDANKAEAISQAALEVIDGKWDKWFQVDVYQAGAGTSQNMNMNEVIATRASELLGGQRGERLVVHPNDDVNQSQSTNDTFHVAMNISALEMLAHQLDPALAMLESALGARAQAFMSIVKAGRTHLQDAVPMRLGDELYAYAVNVGRHRRWIEEAAKGLLELGLGGNAIGTGINTPPDFPQTAVRYVAMHTGLPFRPAENPFVFNQNPDEAVHVSQSLRGLSLALGRIANDLRLLSSGPRTGLGELRLPAVQPGSSIMPGKVNPVMAEMLNMVAFQVQGCDATIAAAGGAGQLELNVMMPVMAHNLLFEIRILANAITAFTNRCVVGITADKEKCEDHAKRSLALATALNREIGYEAAAKIVAHALAHDEGLYEAGLEMKDEVGLEETALKRALDIERLAAPSVWGGDVGSGSD